MLVKGSTGGKVDFCGMGTMMVICKTWGTALYWTVSLDTRCQLCTFDRANDMCPVTISGWRVAEYMLYALPHSMYKTPYWWPFEHVMSSMRCEIPLTYVIQFRVSTFTKHTGTKGMVDKTNNETNNWVESFLSRMCSRCQPSRHD